MTDPDPKISLKKKSAPEKMLLLISDKFSISWVLPDPTNLGSDLTNMNVDCKPSLYKKKMEWYPTKIDL